MPTEAFGFPLTVWVGSTRYTFPAGRDVIVGRGSRSDIRLDGLDSSLSRTYLVLRFDGAQWVAIERSQTGIYLDGVRVPAVNIRDGQSITVGDPQRGPRLTFRLGALAWMPPVPTNPGSAGRPLPPSRQPDRRARPGPPPAQPRQPPSRPPPQRTPSQSPTRPVPSPQPAPPPAPEAPAQPPPAQFGSGRPKPPSQLDTRPVPIARPEPPWEQPRARPAPPEPPAPQPPTPPGPPEPPAPQPPTPPGPPEPPAPQPWPPEPSLEPWARPAEPPSPPAWPQVAQRKGHNLVGLVTGAMQKLLPRRPAPRPHEAAATGPLLHSDIAVDDAQVSPRPAAPHTGTVEGHQLGLTIDGRQVLADVSFTAQPGTLTAVIGPSEANKTALVNLLGGAVQPSSGEVTVAGHNVHAEYESMRAWIGMVPRDDVVHRQLTVEQALGYAAELRLPPDTSAEERRHVVNRVLTELELTRHRTIQVGRLSGAERKRASVAVELLAGPALLVLDEPTAGLDPELERQAMAMLRHLADAGRVVVLATTSLTCLDMCDQVLLLTPAGTTAFAGPPAEIEAALSSADWSDVVAQISPEQRHTAPPETKPPEAPGAPPGPPAHASLVRQIAVAARRQAWLIVGDQRYFIFLAILPFFFGALSLVVPGHAGLGPADPYGDSPDEALEIVVVLIIGAVFMGTALTIRDLFADRRLFRWEQTVGLSASAYLAAKIIVCSLVAIVQTAILTAITVLGKGAPTRPAVLLGDPVFELYATVAATAIVSAIVALALFSLAKYREQIPPIAVLVILLSLVFCGGLFPLDNQLGLEQISGLFPSRWGVAASASSIDMQTIDLLAPQDGLWTHSAGCWVLDMAMLILFGALGTGFLRWRLRPPARRLHGE